MGFTKLDERILQSSVMAADPWTFKVWIALLAACRENGIAYVSAVYLKAICHMAEASVEKALEKLAAPDLHSRSRIDKGRRIRRTDGGYKIINYEVYREVSIKDVEAERKRIYRASKKACPGQSGTVQGPSASASVYASASSSKEGGKGGEEDFNNFWATYQRKVGKADALAAWRSIKKEDRAAVTVASINYTRLIQKLKTEIQYIKHPATFLRKDRWRDYAVEGEGALDYAKQPEAGQFIHRSAEDGLVLARSRTEYEAARAAFMKAKGYKTEDDIPFKEVETFADFVARKRREERQK